MDKMIIEKLTHDIIEGEFECGNASINRQIAESYFATLLQYAYAYEVSINECVVGYYMLRLRTINMQYAPSEIQEYDTSLLSNLSALHIHYIAVDKKYQKKSIGTTILQTIIAQGLNICKQLPITLITLDALKDKYEWYKARGFQPFDENDLKKEITTIPMYMSCILDQTAVNNYGNV